MPTEVDILTKEYDRLFFELQELECRCRDIKVIREALGLRIRELHKEQEERNNGKDSD